MHKHKVQCLGHITKSLLIDVLANNLIVVSIALFLIAYIYIYEFHTYEPYQHYLQCGGEPTPYNWSTINPQTPPYTDHEFVNNYWNPIHQILIYELIGSSPCTPPAILYTMPYRPFAPQMIVATFSLTPKTIEKHTARTQPWHVQDLNIDTLPHCSVCCRLRTPWKQTSWLTIRTNTYI